MNTILVPTDFSNNAWVAIQYAANLALDKNKRLFILHTFSPYYSSFNSMDSNIRMLEQTEKIANAEMHVIKERLKEEFPSLEYECQSLEGELSEVIANEDKTVHFELIIMGTKGATGLKYAFMGSNTFNVINKTKIPVLAVPAESHYALGKVGILSNYKNTEIDVLNKFIKVVGKEFSAVLLHVHEGGNGYERIYAETWKELVKDQTGLLDITYKIGEGDSVKAVLNSMMGEEDVQLLLVTNNSKSFFKSLFNKDIVRELALKPQIPILFTKV